MNETTGTTATLPPAQSADLFPAAANQPPEKPAGFGPIAGESRDRDRKVFDPSKHLPEKDENGRWKRKDGPAKRGRPPGSKSAPKPAASKGTAADSTRADFSDIERAAAEPSPPANGEPPAAPANAVVMSDNQTADTVIGVIQTALVLIGDDEGVLSDTEKLLLRAPLVRVLEKYNVGNNVMPAEIDLALALAGLIVTRLQRPKTATWFAKVKAWAVSQWFSGKGRALAREIQSHVGTGTAP